LPIAEPACCAMGKRRHYSSAAAPPPAAARAALFAQRGERVPPPAAPGLPILYTNSGEAADAWARPQPTRPPRRADDPVGRHQSMAHSPEKGHQQRAVVDCCIIIVRRQVAEHAAAPAGGVLGFDIEWRPQFRAGAAQNPTVRPHCAAVMCCWRWCCACA
jgi:hypothetical protein